MRSIVQKDRVVPVGNRIVIEEIHQKQSDIIETPDNAHGRPVMGMVTAVSQESEATFSVGDKVIFGSWAGIELEIGRDEDGRGIKIRVLAEDEIVGKIND